VNIAGRRRAVAAFRVILAALIVIGLVIAAL
jgi:hypothetical protein